MDTDFLTGRNVLVMGLGRFGGGVDTANFLCRCGAHVTVTDLATRAALADSISRLSDCPRVEYHLGRHNENDFDETDVVVVNPAVRPDNKFVEIARSAGALLTSQIEIFFHLCPAKIISITGANGKSTTAALTAHLLKSVKREAGSVKRKTQYAILPADLSGEALAKTETRRAKAGRDTRYENVWLSGNIGNQPLLTILDKISPDDLIVLEISSFQIEQLARSKLARRGGLAPHVALLTNLTPNHLDRYGSFDNYCASKKPLFEFQKLDEQDPAVSIFNRDDPIASQWFQNYKNDKGRICIQFSAADVPDDIRESFTLPGRANLENLAAALAVINHLGLETEHIKNALPRFKALPHRLQLITETNAVKWFNDSKATTPESTVTALDAFTQPIILIAGGYDKHVSFESLAQKIIQKAKAAILIGQTATKIASTIRNTQYVIRNTSIKIVDSLASAVNLAAQLAAAGDVVLLSPACASYDMFENFQQRGDTFTKLVREITA